VAVCVMATVIVVWQKVIVTLVGSSFFLVIVSALCVYAAFVLIIIATGLIRRADGAFVRSLR
jgi:hypothetical protein